MLFSVLYLSARWALLYAVVKKWLDSVASSQYVASHLVTLKGILLRQNKYVNNMLPKKINKVCIILQAAAGQQDPRVKN